MRERSGAETAAEQVDALAGVARLALDLRLACLAAAMFTVGEHPSPVASTALLLVALPISLVPLLRWTDTAPAVMRRTWPVLLDALLAAVLLVAVPGDALQVLAGATVALAVLVGGGSGGLATLVVMLVAQVAAVLGGQQHVAEACTHGAVLSALAWVALHLRRLLLDRAALRREVERARVAAARHGERDRLARDLHDSLASTLHGVHLLAGSLEGKLLAGADQDGTAARAREVADAADRARREARELIADLREEAGADLLTALDDVVATAAVRGVRVRVTTDAPFALATAAVHELSCVLRELVENAVRHAGGGDVVVALDLVRRGTPSGPGTAVLRCAVTDRGPGLAGAVDLDALRRAGHYGLVGVHERLAGLGGSVSLEHPAAGGLRVVLEVPLDGGAAPLGGADARRPPRSTATRRLRLPHPRRAVAS